MENKNLVSKEEYEKIQKQKAKEIAEKELLSAKLGAVDSLWSPQEELKIYTFDGTKKPRKLVLKPKGSEYRDNYVEQKNPIKGIVVFYINRDEKGNAVGQQKYLQIISDKGVFTNDFVDAEKVEPYYVDIIRKKGKGYTPSQLESAMKKFNIKDIENVKQEDMIASNFTGLDDINSAMSRYGADGLEMLNASGLDDSILEKHSNLVNENLLDGLTENTSLLNADGCYSNLVNENLLDGLTENTSLLSANGEEDYSNGIGDWLKRTFGKKEEKDALKAIANPETDIVDAPTMAQAHKESGSKKPLRDWLSSGGGREAIKVALDIANVFLAQKALKSEEAGKDKTDTKSETKSETKPETEPKGDTKKEVTILGMSPITFGIVTASVLALTSVIVIVAMRKK